TMRLTALYVCGTLLAFSSLSWIRAEEGVLLGDRGFGPCTATLRPVGACRPGDHDNTCPFHVSLPPLVVHLPQHVLELENIMQDLQKLKESVDELREMCADCAGGQAARNCERKNEGELNGVRASKPGEKHKSGIKPEADKRQKNAKNDHKPNQGPSTEEKPKLNQRNKPHKPTGHCIFLSHIFSSLFLACSVLHITLLPFDLIKSSSTVIRDCSDHLLRGKTRSGLYLVTPDLRSSSFQVFCDMELDGGGWTLLQRRQDGSVSFNRPWVEYQAGFGVLDGGEFWLGNNKMHLLTRDRDMELRVELEDFDGVTEHAQYEHFRVASERLRYRLTVGGYSGTAGDALRFSKTYDHNNRAFTTPDRDNDRYPSGNCGAYYSSGWWFDACMAANLNGKYYFGKYKGVRDGIFWGTWHNISTEYYPTNERQSFKSVRMMTRPKSFGL
uniref:Fibrinogen like 2 n=1 Tax=Poecilia formosa TaxID=48698 RepID=A0A087YH57_POEFO